MTVQNTYEQRIGKGAPGQVADLQTSNRISKVSEGTIPYGRAVVEGSAYSQAALPSAPAQNFFGIAMRLITRLNNQAGEAPYEQYDDMSIMNEGSIFVLAEVAVSAGDNVFFRHAGAGDAGALRNDADGGNATQIVNCKFEEDAAAGEVVRIKLASRV